MGMMINRRRVCGGKSLPYDYEVEYLESDGTQSILLDFYATNKTRVQAKWYATDSISWQGWFGSCGNGNRTQRYVLQQSNSTTIQGFYSTRYRGFTIGSLPRLCVCDLNKNVWEINGITQTFTDATFTSNYRFGFIGFTDYNQDYIIIHAKMKLYYFKLSNNDILLYDFIPVVKNNVGYFYDKVSGQLFGNQETGNFIIGPRVS